LEYNGSLYNEDAPFSLGALANQFHRIDAFGPAEEDVCVFGTPAFLPDELTTDIATYIRRGAPPSQVVDALLAIAIRVDEEGLE
jgi:hypothetical protein